MRHRTCRCGHPAAAHEHWRPGDDCGTCGRALCPRYRPVPSRWVRALLARIGGRRGVDP